MLVVVKLSMRLGARNLSMTINSSDDWGFELQHTQELTLQNEP